MQQANQTNLASPIPNSPSIKLEPQYHETSPSSFTSSTESLSYPTSSYNHNYQNYYYNYCTGNQTNSSPANYYYKPNPHGYTSYSEQANSNFMYSNWNSSDYSTSIPSSNYYNTSYYNSSPLTTASTSSNSSPTSSLTSTISNGYDNFTLNSCYQNSINQVSLSLALLFNIYCYLTY